MFKRCKIVMLPIKEKAQNCLILHNNRLSYNTTGYFTQAYLNDIDAIAYHLYVLSDDEVKNGDYVCPVNYQAIWVFQKAPCPMPYWGNEKTCKKIIASTDPALTDNQCDGCRAGIPVDVSNIHRTIPLHNSMVCQKSKYQFPQPSRLFIDKYVSEYNKGNIITDVMVEYFSNSDTGNNVVEWDDLKVNPKDNTITTKKLKGSWTKDEVIEICKKLNFKFGVATSNDLHKWIETNLN